MVTQFRYHNAFEEISPFDVENENAEYKIFTSFNDMLNMTNEIYSANVLSGYKFGNLENILSQYVAAPDILRTIRDKEFYPEAVYHLGFYMLNNNSIKTFYILRSADNWAVAPGTEEFLDNYYVGCISINYNWSYQTLTEGMGIPKNYTLLSQSNNVILDNRQFFILNVFCPLSVGHCDKFKIYGGEYELSFKNLEKLVPNPYSPGEYIHPWVYEFNLNSANNNLYGNFNIIGNSTSGSENIIGVFPEDFNPNFASPAQHITSIDWTGDGVNDTYIVDKLKGGPGIDTNNDGIVDVIYPECFKYITLIYPLQMVGDDEISIRFTHDTTQNRTFKIKNTCNKYCLYFLNSFGGWESFLFKDSSIKKDNITNHNYKQKNVNITNKLLDYDYINPLFMSGGNTIYNKEYKETWDLQTGWINEEDSKRVNSIMLSNMAYLHDLEEGTIIPVIVTNKTNEYKTYKNQNKKLLRYTISVEGTQEKYTM